MRMMIGVMILSFICGMTVWALVHILVSDTEIMIVQRCPSLPVVGHMHDHIDTY